METSGNGGGGFLKGFLTGTLLGVLAGILLAPKPGKELRSDLIEKGSDVIDRTKQFSSDTQSKAKEIITEVRQVAEKFGICKKTETEMDVPHPI